MMPQLLGVEPVSSEPSSLLQRNGVSMKLTIPDVNKNRPKRHGWCKLGDCLEDPHRHFKAMDSLRLNVDRSDNVNCQDYCNKHLHLFLVLVDLKHNRCITC